MVKPTKAHLEWADLELGVIIHYLMDSYNPEYALFDTIADGTMLERFPASAFAPEGWDTDQWMRSAAAMGAKYAVLVANHCTGFSMWPTKANDYSVASCSFKDGKGDIVREFIESCKQYNIKPGLYYSTGCNGYYGIGEAGNTPEFYTSEETAEKARAYVKVVEAQVKELWTEYGDLFEIWFDGGVVSPEEGGPDLVPLLQKYQPNAICFQGPKGHAHNVRWVGNEDGLAPKECWSCTNAGEARYDGTIPDEQAGVGDPDGKYFWPAETDMANRDNKRAFGGGWAWKEGEKDTAFSPEYLLECYIRSVGRNSNLLMGMAIANNGRFEDEDQFVQFGQLIEKTFGDSARIASIPGSDALVQKIELASARKIQYIVLQEDMTQGHQVRGFRVLIDGTEEMCGECIGHKRIIPIAQRQAQQICVEITNYVGHPVMRSIAVY